MKTSLDQYKQSPTANATSIEIRERQLLAIIRFFESCDEVIYMLAEERNAAYKRGVQHGQELANVEQSNQVSRHWKKSYHHDREVQRSYANYEQSIKWADYL